MGLGSQMQLHLGPAYHGMWCICSTFTLLQQFPLYTLTSTLLLMVLCLNGTCTSSIHHYLVIWSLILNPIQAISPFSSLCSSFRNDTPQRNKPFSNRSVGEHHTCLITPELFSRQLCKITSLYALINHEQYQSTSVGRQFWGVPEEQTGLPHNQLQLQGQRSIKCVWAFWSLASLNQCF